MDPEARRGPRSARGQRESLLFAIGIIDANLPEGLLPTITPALGVQRMARRRLLVRRLPALETLSAVTMVCTDETGTLTVNDTTVRQVWLRGFVSLSEAPLQRCVVHLQRNLDAQPAYASCSPIEHCRKIAIEVEEGGDADQPAHLLAEWAIAMDAADQ